MQTPQNSRTPIIYLSYVITNIYFNFTHISNPKNNSCNFHLKALKYLPFIVLPFIAAIYFHQHLFTLSEDILSNHCCCGSLPVPTNDSFTLCPDFLIILGKCIALKLGSLLLLEAESLTGYLHFKPLFQILSQIHIYANACSTSSCRCLTAQTLASP